MASLGEHKLESAIMDLNEAIALEPTNVLAFIERGWAYGINREFNKAIADESEAIRLNADRHPLGNAKAYCFRGDWYGNLGQYKKAIADLNEAIRLDPTSTVAFSYRSWVYTQIGEKEKAESDAKRARELEGKSDTESAGSRDSRN